MESSAHSPEHQAGRTTAADLFPYQEDWVAMQGGRPRVFRNPNKPSSVWMVLHVYEEHPDAKNRFKSGAIVPTTPPEGGRFTTRRISLERPDDNNRIIERDFRVPSFMVRTLHGDVCDERSASQGGGSYERIGNQEQYEATLEHYRNQGFEELRFGLNDASSGYIMRLLPTIRPSRPLA